MNPQQMIGPKAMLACSLVVALGSAIWAFMPSDESRGNMTTTPVHTGRSVETASTEVQPEVSEFPGMELWTKPPPVVVPPAPPPPLRLNAELLSIRESEPEGRRTATIYLSDTGEILRLQTGDQHAGMTVAEINELAVKFVLGEQSLIITRKLD
ncbi:MAG: hypothetical protein ACIAQF_00615 [Phycisphaerales bacterium JB065]